MAGGSSHRGRCKRYCPVRDPSVSYTGTPAANRPRIGVPHDDYNTRRNILDSLPEAFVRVRPWTLGRARSAVRWRLTGRIRRREHFSFTEPFTPDVDLFHFWNCVADVRRPWATTFEQTIPLWDTDDPHDLRRGMRLALRDDCRRLIAFSRAALSDATAQWHKLLPAADTDALIQKTEVLLPPQHVLERPAVDDEPAVVRFAFVGKEFYRKGGLEALEALHSLYAAGRQDWRGTVIGDLDSHGDYASHTSVAAKTRALELLERLGPLVTFRPTPVPHGEVADLLKRADFYLLPTYADTFGYTALEAQACGAVVLASDVGSLPEFVSEQTGVVVPLRHRLQGWRIPAGKVTDVKAEFTELVRTAVAQCLDMPVSQRTILRDSATLQLRAHHDPARHAARLRGLYAEMLRS
jgi:glycosyltransferase involved in cell wall biosynthesis